MSNTTPPRSPWRVRLEAARSPNRSRNGSTWTTSFPPRVLQSGSSIIVKSSTIDSRTQPTGSFVISSPLQVTLNMIPWRNIIPDLANNLYVYPYTNGELEGSVGFTRPDPHVFAAPTSADLDIWQPIVLPVIFTIPAGTYTAGGLADTITRLMSQMDRVDLLDAPRYFDPRAGNAPNLGYLDPVAGGQEGAPRLNTPAKPLAHPYRYVFGVAGQESWFEAGNTQIRLCSTLFATSDTGNDYNPIGNPTNGHLKAHVMDKPEYMGCTQPALEYDPIANRFSFLLHTPILNGIPPTPATPSTCWSPWLHFDQGDTAALPNTGVIYFAAYGGCYLQSMEPRSFWESLGFDIDAITIQFGEGTETYPSGAIIHKIGADGAANARTAFDLTTGQFLGLGSMPVVIAPSGVTSCMTLMDPIAHNGQPSADLNDALYMSEATDTFALVAPRPPAASNDGGEYLIEIAFGGVTSGLVAEGETLPLIQSSVKKYYSSDGQFSYGSPLDAFPSQYFGEPVAVGSATVRILNAVTHQEESLGANSSITIEII